MEWAHLHTLKWFESCLIWFLLSYGSNFRCRKLSESWKNIFFCKLRKKFHCFCYWMDFHKYKFVSASLFLPRSHALSLSHSFFGSMLWNAFPLNSVLFVWHVFCVVLFYFSIFSVVFALFFLLSNFCCAHNLYLNRGLSGDFSFGSFTTNLALVQLYTYNHKRTSARTLTHSDSTFGCECVCAPP